MFNSENCDKENCPARELCYFDCPLNKVYERVTEKAPENAKGVYSDILETLANGDNIFLTASGGKGKSYLLNQLRNELPDLKVCATTGVAALNIGGCTLHSMLGIGLANKPVKALLSNITKWKLDRLNEIELLAIDEVSMMSGSLLNYCNEFLKLARMDNRPFGGIQVILIGDFCQLPPVELNNPASRDFAFKSSTWFELNLKTFELVHNFRQDGDKEYLNMLEELRNGKINQKGYDLVKSREITPTDDIPRIYPVNSQVDEYNRKKVADLGNKIYVNKASFEAVNPNVRKNQAWFENLVSNMKKASIVPDTLEICKGCRVRCTQNLDIDNNIANGSLGTVEAIDVANGRIEQINVEFDSGTNRMIKPTQTDMHDSEGNVLISMWQFPLKVAFAQTSHSCQGSTMEKAFIDFQKFFEINQAYVALSRVKSSKGLYVANFDIKYLKYSKEVLDFYNTLKSDRNMVELIKGGQ